ncbi:MAG: cell division protein FtsL [Pseudomonadales bacterium]|nr:cell division protein FtsL [Pseudomonadales bacterium]
MNILTDKMERNGEDLFPKGANWIVLLLVLIVIVSISVVYSTYVTRGRISSLQELEKERDDMNVQWSQLILEQNSLGSYARVEKEATKKLKMYVPTSKDIVMLKSVNLMNSGVASNP